MVEGQTLESNLYRRAIIRILKPLVNASFRLCVCWWMQCEPSAIHLQCCVRWDVRSILSVCALAGSLSLPACLVLSVCLSLSSLHLPARTHVFTCNLFLHRFWTSGSRDIMKSTLNLTVIGYIHHPNCKTAFNIAAELQPPTRMWYYHPLRWH